MKHYQKIKVDFNKIVRLRFADNEEYTIKIIDEKTKVSGSKQQGELLIDAKTPLAQAILGHSTGEKITYKVEGKIQQVAIVQIKSY